VAGDEALVQVFVHVPEEADMADQMAKDFDDESSRRGFASLGTEIARGSVLGFELQLGDASVVDPFQELRWQGRPESVQFGVEIPDGRAPRNLIGRVLVSQESIPIGRVRFKLRVRDPMAPSERSSLPTGRPTRYEKAFISYASRDRNEVLRRVQMLSAVGVGFYQDVLDLEPGELWSRRLFRSIDDCDVLFLFWSSAARESEWVEKEWRYGLERKGEEFIHPIIIEGPPVPDPPPELAHLHFGDRIVYFMQ
jgi:hypothetical protein